MVCEYNFGRMGPSNCNLSSDEACLLDYATRARKGLAKLVATEGRMMPYTLDFCVSYFSWVNPWKGDFSR
jgi:hypothetical protein